MRISKLKFFDSIIRNLTIIKILKECLIFWKKYCLMIPIGSFAIKRIDIFSSFCPFLCKICLQFYSCFFCENLNGFTKFNLLNFHEKLDWTPSFSARETMGNIFLWRYDKRCRLFLMKWTKSLIIYSGLLCLNIAIYDVENLYPRFNFLRKRHAL